MDPVEVRFFALLEKLDVGLNGDLSMDTQLFKSGLLDSMSLFNLAEWIEIEMNEPLDLTKIDILQDWETVGSVLNFIKKHRGNNSN